MAHTFDGFILFQITSDCVWTIGIVACLCIQVFAVAMVYSTRSKTTCQLKECLANTALFSAIALVVLLFSLPTIVFLVFRGSDLSSWQESFSILSSFLDTCGSQSVGNNVSSTELVFISQSVLHWQRQEEPPEKACQVEPHPSEASST